MAQSPEYGIELETGDIINITVSRGPETVTVPNIIGLDYTYAARHLDALGIRVITSIAPVDNIIDQPGMVVMVDPQPGASINKGDIVKVMISVLEPLNEVPGLTGLDIKEASSYLESRNIIYDIIYVEPDYSFQKDEVLKQWPEEGTYITPESPVIIFVGK